MGCTELKETLPDLKKLKTLCVYVCVCVVCVCVCVCVVCVCVCVERKEMRQSALQCSLEGKHEHQEHGSQLLSQTWGVRGFLEGCVGDVGKSKHFRHRNS